MTPVKITSVAQPKILGPRTLIAMPIKARRMAPSRIIRSGARCPSSRRIDGPKLIDFSTGRGPPNIRGPPPLGAYLGRSGAFGPWAGWPGWGAEPFGLGSAERD